MTHRLTIETHSSWRINCYDLEKSVASITKHEELETIKKKVLPVSQKMRN